MSKIFWIILTLSVVLTACDESYKPTPKALGTTNQIKIICDNTLWNGPLGDTIRAYYESPYPMMPSSEPYFKVKHFTADAIMNNYLRRELRTYVIIGNLADKDSPTTKLIARDLGAEKMRKAREDSGYNNSVGRNKWAEPQLLIYLFGQDENDLAKAIRTSFPSVAKRINDHDKSIIKPTVYQHDENKSIMDTIRAQFGLDIKIPGEYKTALIDDEAIWLRKNYNNKIFYNIIIDKKEYKEQSDLSVASLIQWRNELGKRMVSGSNEGSYMVTNDQDLPIYQTQEDINGQYAIHLRGIWEMEGDFAGGPFFSYAILSSDQKEIVFIDAFVYAPGEPKQKHMQYLDHIASTAKIN